LYLGLIPWAVLYFDQAMTSLSMKGENFHNLSATVSEIKSWFRYYTSQYDNVTGEVIQNKESNQSDDESIIDTIKSSQSQRHVSKLLKSQSNDSIFNINPKKPIQLNNYEHIVTYKLFSKMSNEFGIVPYLMKESQLFRYFN
jgi:hypothetical protein